MVTTLINLRRTLKRESAKSGVVDLQIKREGPALNILEGGRF